MLSEKTFSELNVDDAAQFDVVIDDTLVDAFASLSGDRSPLHTDETFAAQTPLQKRVAHGMIAGALFSRLVGMHLPGKHALYLSQTLFFRKPVFLPTTVMVTGVVRQKSDATRIITLSTTLTDVATGTVLVDGEALVKVLV